MTRDCDPVALRIAEIYRVRRARFDRKSGCGEQSLKLDPFSRFSRQGKEKRAGADALYVKRNRLGALDHEERSTEIEPDRPQFTVWFMVTGDLAQAEQIAIKSCDAFEVAGAER